MDLQSKIYGELQTESAVGCFKRWLKIARLQVVWSFEMQLEILLESFWHSHYTS